MKIGTTELIVVLLIVVVLFGPTQIPKLSKMLGKSIKNFRSGMADDDNDKKSADKENATDTAEQ